MRRALLLVCALLGCVSGNVSEYNRTSPERVKIDVSIPQANAAQAVERTKAAFDAEGLTVASVEGGIVTSAPAVPRPDAMFRGAIVYRAMVLPDSAGARVVLSAVMRSLDAGAFTQAMSGVRQDDEIGRPITSRWGSHGPEGNYHGWEKLERIAAILAPPSGG